MQCLQLGHQHQGQVPARRITADHHTIRGSALRKQVPVGRYAIVDLCRVGVLGC